MIKLTDFSTEAPPQADKDAIQAETQQLIKRLGELQHLMYAEAKHCAVVIMQGMDASGKDGAARNVFAECSIAGLNLVSFKKPYELEMRHDFLWRVHQMVPQKGYLSIFNRSFWRSTYYFCR